MIWFASGLQDVISPLALPALSAVGPGAETGFKVLAAGRVFAWLQALLVVVTQHTAVCDKLINRFTYWLLPLPEELPTTALTVH